MLAKKTAGRNVYVRVLDEAVTGLLGFCGLKVVTMTLSSGQQASVGCGWRDNELSWNPERIKHLFSDLFSVISDWWFPLEETLNREDEHDDEIIQHGLFKCYSYHFISMSIFLSLCFLIFPHLCLSFLHTVWLFYGQLAHTLPRYYWSR